MTIILLIILLAIQSTEVINFPSYIWIITGIAIFLNFVKYGIGIGIKFNNKKLQEEDKEEDKNENKKTEKN